jgi:SAM-dependent methyltransferase
MKNNKFYEIWKHEEAIAHIHGWDFSHIADRWKEDTDFPWDYRAAVLEALRPEMQILDIDTGGGEFLLSLGHPHSHTAAMENYPPNISLCAETLLPLGIDFRPGDGDGQYPFEDSRFDLVINRHGAFNPAEIHRILKPGGIFITQQVGAENDRELVALLGYDTMPHFSEQYLKITEEKFRKAGFSILRATECFRPVRFFDVGALVWFARIIPWEYPGFSVDTHWDALLDAQALLEQQGFIEAHTHRLFLMARKA